jgi:energy-coupling factor transport system substrate-specific component
MESRALGMIEVRGMLGAVEAADAALKSAAVRLLRSRKVGGGLVTVFLTGDVAAVQSAVDAAVVSLNRLGLRCSSHVIPRLTPDVFTMLAESSAAHTKPVAPEPPCGKETSGPSSSGDAVSAEKNISGERPSGCGMKDAVGEEDDVEDAEDEGDVSTVWSGDAPDLENMTVMELRRLARTVGLETMTRKQIRFAGKAELLRELTAFWNNRGGESE